MNITKLKIKNLLKWCFATLPRKIVSCLIILGILVSSLWFLFRPTPAEAGLPVLWLKFDEGYGTTAYDFTDNNNDFTLSAESWTGYGKYSRAWYGDGAKWVSRADDADFDFAAADNFSISMWVKSSSPTNPGSQEFLIDKESSSAGYAIYFDTDGDIIFGVDDDATWDPDDTAGDIGTDYYDGQWHHITAIKEGTTSIKIYIDGILKDTDNTISATGTLANSASIIIGSQDTSDDTDDFNGYIDEVKIYSYKRTEEQIKIDYNRGVAAKMGAEYTLPAGLVGYWPMDEGSGSTVYDVSGNGNDGTLEGDTAWKNAVDCKYGSCLSFGGEVTDYVTFGHKPEFDFNNTTSFTYTGWFYLNTKCQTTLFIKGSTNFILYYKYGNNRWQFVVGGIVAVYNDSAPEGKWTHFAAVFDVSVPELRLYINGDIQYPCGGTFSDFSNTNDLRIGVYHDGQIDNVMIYDRALTQEEISWIYSRGRP
mgnify:CR=1 FL=1